ncbi:MAG TPA: hypothetical protein VII22_14945 [Streptosporangiaceae bacterium]
MKYPELITTTAMIAAASDITADGPAAPPDDHELPNDFAEALVILGRACYWQVYPA